MSDTEDEAVLKERVSALEEEIRILKETQKRKKWIHAHHKLLSTSIGIVLGFLAATIVYVVLWGLSYTTLSGWSYLACMIISSCLIPFAIVLPLIIWAKAPSFSIKLYRAFIITILLVEAPLVWIDPIQLKPLGQLPSLNILFVVLMTIQFLPLLALFGVSGWLAKYIGYGEVLQGSTLCFEVELEYDDLRKKLEGLSQDFNYIFESHNNETQSLRYRKENRRLQVFMKSSKKDKIHLFLVLHSTENDLPKSVGLDEIRRLGKGIVGWLQAQVRTQFTETEDSPFLKQVIKDSEKAFVRQAVGIPSRKEAVLWLKAHWKDIALAITTTAALFGIWKALFP